MKTVTMMLSILLTLTMALSQSKKEAKKTSADVVPAPKSYDGKIWVVTYSDFSYVAQAEDESQKGTNSFAFRRIYLGYDQTISDQFSAQILLEADNADTSLTGTMDFYVKHAYLEWKELVPSSSVFFGLSQTPSMLLSEKLWGYRSLEKVILDRNGLVQTSDMGVGLKGQFVSDGTVGYALMVGNGQGVRMENDKLKRLYGEFYFQPMKGGVVELYTDFENGANAESKLTGKGLLGYQSTAASIGAEGFYRTVKNGASAVSGTDSNIVGVSAYTSFHFAESIRGVLRADFYDANYSVTTSGLREIFGIAGIDYAPAKDVDVIPNVLYTHWLYKNKQSGDPALKDDITVRLTVAYAFSARVP